MEYAPREIVPLLAIATDLSTVYSQAHSCLVQSPVVADQSSYFERWQARADAPAAFGLCLMILCRFRPSTSILCLSSKSSRL